MRTGLSIDDVGVSRGTVFHEVRPGAGFETGDFVKEKDGGATAERLILFCMVFVLCVPRPWDFFIRISFIFLQISFRGEVLSS